MLADLGALLTGLALLALLYAAVAGLVAARHRGAPEGMEEGSASSAPTVCAGDPAAGSESGRNALRVAVLEILRGFPGNRSNADCALVRLYLDCRRRGEVPGMPSVHLPPGHCSALPRFDGVEGG